MCLGDQRTDKSHAFAQFVLAAQTDSSLDEAFLYLGHFYLEVSGDKPRAIKCYQKAFTLNPQNLEAAQKLSELYMQAQDLTSTHHILESAAKSNLRSFWAWSNLGIMQMVISKVRLFEFMLSFL